MNKQINIESPEKVFDRFLNWFDLNKRIAFFSSLIIGLITHITMITEMIMSQDGLWNSIKYSRAGDWELTLGRWGIQIVQRLTSYIAIPTIVTIFCILIMSVIVVLFVDIFKIKKKLSAILIGCIVVISPSLTATLLYIYTAFAYCIAMLFAVLVVWFIYKFKYKKIGLVLSSLFVMMMLSIYQSYIGVVVGLCMILTINQLINKDTYKEILINILKTVVSIVIGSVIYFIITMILLNFANLDIATYKNINESSITTIVFSIGTSIRQAYKDFVDYFIGNNIVYNSNYKRGIYYSLLFIAFLISMGLICKNIDEKSKKDKLIRVLLIFIVLLLMPLGLNIIDVLVPNNIIYLLTAMQLILVNIMIVVLFEKLENHNILKWINLFLISVIILTYYLAINSSYAAIKMTYNQAYSTTSRIVDRIENIPGYNMNETYVLLGGIVGNNNFPRTSNLYGYTLGELVNNVVFHGTYGGQIGTWESFLKIYFGIDMKFVSDSVYYEIVNSQAYKDMEIFPAQSSVQVINDVVVVKLSNEPPLPY